MNSISLKFFGKSLLFFIGPLIASALLALPLWLNNQDFFLAINIGQLIGSLCLIHFMIGWHNSGFFTPVNTFALSAVGVFVLVRVVIFVTTVPIAKIELNWEILLWGLFGVTLLSVLAEEVHFQGLMVSGFKLHGISLWATLITIPSLFTLLHLYSAGPMWLPLFFTDGLLFVYIRLHSKSIYPSMLAHLLINFILTHVLVPNYDQLTTTATWLYLAAIVVTNIAMIGTLFFINRNEQSKLPLNQLINSKTA